MFSLQLKTNVSLFVLGFCGILTNVSSALLLFICIEILLLSVNLNFIIFSAYLDDFYGQIFAIFILTIAAAESALGLAILIIFNRLRGNISVNGSMLLKH